MATMSACQTSKSNIFMPILTTNDVHVEKSTLVIKRLSDNKVWVSNPIRAKLRFSPASTSKIPHTLIALQSNQFQAETVFKWDGQNRKFQFWNQDLTLTQAYKRSAIWVYQDITTRLGHNEMATWLKEFNYGNCDIGPVSNITRYWLHGPLEISAIEQVEFLSKLSQQEFPLSNRTYENAWKIFKNDTNGSYVLYAKTGWWHDDVATDIGWFVGWVTTPEPSQTYVFALNLDIHTSADRKKRKRIVMDGLKTIGAWPH